jgi:hypothetical protein
VEEPRAALSEGSCVIQRKGNGTRQGVSLPPPVVATFESVSHSSRFGASCLRCFGVRAGGVILKQLPHCRSSSTPTFHDLSLAISFGRSSLVLRWLYSDETRTPSLASQLAHGQPCQPVGTDDLQRY